MSTQPEPTDDDAFRLLMDAAPEESKPQPRFAPASPNSSTTLTAALSDTANRPALKPPASDVARAATERAASSLAPASRRMPTSGKVPVPVPVSARTPVTVPKEREEYAGVVITPLAAAGMLLTVIGVFWLAFSLNEGGGVSPSAVAVMVFGLLAVAQGFFRFGQK